MNPIVGLLGALSAVTAVYVAEWARAIKAVGKLGDPSTSPVGDARFPTPAQILVGYVTNFLDTLGIGSFATTTAIFRLRKMVNDRVIPGTLNIGHTLPTTAQTFIYTSLIPVDVTTMFSMIAAAILGAWLGAGIVACWSKQKVQIGMGIALLLAATLMFMQQQELFPGGGVALGVTGLRLLVGVTVNFMLGALMTLGIGLYAPCMILVSLLGMNPKAAFPIMMGSCAFLMPVASLRFIRERSYALRPALGLLAGGIPAVLLAAYIVKELPLTYVRWLVIVVVIYTAITMLRSAFVERQAVSEPVEAAG
jgi:uncharacterized membrane protein YfcA